MAIENARHREQISWLSAIQHDTHKLATGSMAEAYKQLAKFTWESSMPGRFGIQAHPFNNHASNFNAAGSSPSPFSEQKILDALQLIVRNTNGMRNFRGVSRYA
jgi:hypothetical protein